MTIDLTNSDTSQVIIRPNDTYLRLLLLFLHTIFMLRWGFCRGLSASGSGSGGSSSAIGKLASRPPIFRPRRFATVIPFAERLHRGACIVVVVVLMILITIYERWRTLQRNNNQGKVIKTENLNSYLHRVNSIGQGCSAYTCMLDQPLHWIGLSSDHFNWPCYRPFI